MLEAIDKNGIESDIKDIIRGVYCYYWVIV